MALAGEITELEKLTEIYRMIRKRHISHPLYLNRNLSYMHHRSMKRTMTNINRRKNFKIDNLLYENNINENRGTYIFHENITNGSAKRLRLNAIEDLWPRFMFQFFISDKTTKETKVMTKPECPWCRIDSKTVVALYKHLKYCHPLLSINLQETNATLPVIEISVAKSDMWKKICEDDKLPLPLIRRTFYNPQTNYPLNRREIKKPSVSDLQPAWQYEKVCRNIEEFTDVNSGEKELMKVWTKFVDDSNFVGDIQIPKAIELFIENHGRMIMERKLYKNFLLHLINLHDHMILSPKHMLEATTKLQKMIMDNNMQHCLISREILDDLVLETSKDDPESDSGFEMRSISVNSQDGVIYID